MKKIDFKVYDLTGSYLIEDDGKILAETQLSSNEWACPFTIDEKYVRGSVKDPSVYKFNKDEIEEIKKGNYIVLRSEDTGIVNVILAEIISIEDNFKPDEKLAKLIEKYHPKADDLQEKLAREMPIE